MNIKHKTHFQPSTESLEKWLSTRKKSINMSGVSIPQFFSDTGDSVDSAWFFIACIGELLGLIVTIYGGLKNGGIFLIFATLSIIMFVFCDFFFAILLHRKKSTICKTKTLILLEDDSRKATLARLDLDLKKGRLIDFLLISGIILFAVFKIIGIVFLSVFNNLILYIPISIVYFIVAYIHIMHTGYYFAYRATQNRIDRDYFEFAHDQHQAKEFSLPVALNNQLKNMPIRHNPHEIVLNPAYDDGLHYLIKARGILTDDDIINLLDGQEGQDKIPLFKACRRLQVESYGITF
ncbi:MAG: hypothetical protein ABFD10_08015 [Prolixibacteraceae bacterium]